MSLVTFFQGVGVAQNTKISFTHSKNGHFFSSSGPGQKAKYPNFGMLNKHF
jgi:hypothetical protein